jgi:ubiquinone/menaquinone biosynthesis C-methylase UbiE
MTPVDPDITKFYATTAEENRLTQGAALLEEARTRELILRHVPPPPAVVLDIGGGAGAYSFWLADAGHTVHLVDAAPRLIAEARRRGGGKVSLASYAVGDARTLDFPPDAADAVLLLGPLYHLTDPKDRAAALAEAKRVLKPGGWIFGAVISRFASALDGLTRDLFKDPRFWGIVRKDLAEGQHRNPTERLDYFTTAYFHRPEEALAEVRAAGFAEPRTYGIEGPGWLLPDVGERMHDPRRRADLLEVVRALESESSVVGISAHMLVVARKP